MLETLFVFVSSTAVAAVVIPVVEDMDVVACVCVRVCSLAYLLACSLAGFLAWLAFLLSCLCVHLIVCAESVFAFGKTSREQKARD